MLFNTYQFALFFLIVYPLYLISGHKWQNRILLVSSYIFYGCWDWRFLSLLALTTAIDHYCAVKIYGTEDIRRRKFFLGISVCSNLTVLGFFKYFNFFASSLQDLLSVFGLHAEMRFLNIILPVGISFYTFQSLSYTIDVFRRNLKPAPRLQDFALFVSYFPQLVAGPIERATHLLPQVLAPRRISIDRFFEGCYLIFWGLFEKVYIADNLAKTADAVFSAPAPYNGIQVLLALYAFAFQIFCDFDGYSNMARGLGRIMGFDIMVNFNLPYFSTDPREFWQRWHISLSTWLKDYLYIPLGGNRRGELITYRNLALTMLIGGLWHGAAWTFVAWGAYHGMLLVLYRIFQPYLAKVPLIKSRLMNGAWTFVRAVFFFHLVCAGWLLFRAGSMAQAWDMLYAVLYNLRVTQYTPIPSYFWLMASSLSILLIVQLSQRARGDLMAVFKWPRALKTALYGIMFYLILFYASPGYHFIYFQF
ncbi:MAG: MBOAT family O-acyltransferase [Candidatus Omnitrophota bacterium]